MPQMGGKFKEIAKKMGFGKLLGSGLLWIYRSLK